MRARLWFLSYGLAIFAALQACASSEQSNAVSGATDARQTGQDGLQTSASGAAGIGPIPSGAAVVSKSGSAGRGATTAASSTGASDFMSAEPPVGVATLPPTSGAAVTAPRGEVKRGDIYHILSEQRILNLNRHRGLQVLDVRNLNQPRLEGRLPIAGEPVELYVTGDRALVLYNSNKNYYGAPDSPDVEEFDGAVILSVDIQDRTQPRLLARVALQGFIVTSRVTVKDGRSTLYVIRQDSGETSVTSYDTTDGALSPKGQLQLKGSVEDAQATADLLLIVGKAGVDLVDISQPVGQLALRGRVVPTGSVNNRFDVDVRGNMLRVVSSTMTANFLQTYALDNPQLPSLLATCQLATRDPASMSQGLSTTLLLEDRAFIVSQYQANAFHAVSIAPDGRCTAHPAYMSSGNDTFLLPVLNNTRLVGVGREDASPGSRLAISMYDASNLDNLMPLLARSAVGLPEGRSEATWDERAFMVLEDFVSAAAADGTAERGMILLPFDDWNEQTGTGGAETQLFTFSDHTLTKRGTIRHGTPVRRAFQVRPATAANISDEQLSLFDTTNPDATSELSRLDLAPNFSRVLIYGNRVARVREPLTAGDSAKVQILDRAADLDGSTVLTSFDVPPASSFYQVGPLLISLSTAKIGTSPDLKYNSRLQVYDLTDPERPSARGSLETELLDDRSYEGEVRARGFAAAAAPPADMLDASPTGGGAQSFVLGASIVLVTTIPHEQAQTDTRRWQSFRVDSIDVRDPDKPVLNARMDLPQNEEALSALADGTTLFLSYQLPMSVGGDARPVVKQYAHVLNFGDPSTLTPDQSMSMSLPGRLIHARDKTVYTEGYEWVGDKRSMSLARLIVDDKRAQLQSSQMLGDRIVSSVRLDDAGGHIIVSSDVTTLTQLGAAEVSHKVTLLDAQTLAMLSETDLKVSASFVTAVNGRAMFLTSDGMLVYDVQDPQRLKALAFYPHYNSIRDVFFSGNEVIFAAGLHGVQHFDAMTFNLLSK